MISVPYGMGQTVEKPLCKINGVWGEAPSKVAGAAAPDNKPLPEGKGLGLGIDAVVNKNWTEKI